MICKYFLPFRGLPVHFVGCLCCAKTFYFDVVLLVDFLLLLSNPKSLCND